MISGASLWAVVLRHTRMWRRDPNFLLGSLYWPVLDILIWGFLGSWIQQARGGQFDNYEVAALLGILLWQIIGRGCNIMCVTFAEELWSNNVINLFSLPLRIGEWIAASVVFTIIMMTITTSTCMLFIALLYNVSLWSIILNYLLFLPPIFFSSMWLAFICLSILVTLGKRGAELGFVIAWFLMPFSGAYYPVAVLPKWGQALSSYLPMSSVFEGMRGYVMHQQDPTAYLIKGYALSIPYAISSLLLFVYCFNRSKRKGLARLAD
ncbi:ABC transporter permease [Candidatus Dependentiae bacterium]|nr:ABC transporter permease [Candidatus Dependentiae bacterium]